MPFDLETTDTKAIYEMSPDDLKAYALACTEAIFDPNMTFAKKFKLRERRFTAEGIILKEMARAKVMK